MKTLLEILFSSEKYLESRQIERPRREAENIIADALSLKRLDLYLQFERPLNDEELSRCREALRRRGLFEPAPYIAGEIDFAGVALTINSQVLIPRPETEILVEKIASELKDKPLEGLEGKVLWDLCTGSGCIAIALKKRFPALKVVASDLSKDALAIAKKNAEKNEVEIEFLEGDLFTPFSGNCDFFVSNPPYISQKEYETLSKEVRLFEPKMALVSGETGFEFYQRISKELKKHLKEAAWMEIGAGQSESVLALFKNEGWSEVSYEKDWAGHDRFLRLFSKLNVS